jgi:hypothetical protein
MISVKLEGKHIFQKIGTFTAGDRFESYLRYKCSNCGLSGRRLSYNAPVILVSDSFSDKRIKNCERDNFVDKYQGKIIQTICKIHNHPQIIIYSKHEIIKPPKGELNGERGMWIDLNGKPWKILDDEYIFAIKPKRANPIIMTRTKTKKNKPKEADWTQYAHLRVRTKTNTPVVPVRTIFKRKRTK